MPWSGMPSHVHSAASAGSLGGARRSHVDLPDPEVPSVGATNWSGGDVPGQAARAQAEVELAAMRDRSRVGTFLARTFDMKRGGGGSGRR